MNINDLTWFEEIVSKLSGKDVLSFVSYLVKDGSADKHNIHVYDVNIVPDRENPRMETLTIEFVAVHKAKKTESWLTYIDYRATSGACSNKRIINTARIITQK